MAAIQIGMAGAKAAGLVTTVTLAVAFGCPFEGQVDRAAVIDLAAQAASFGPDEIALADTIGCADPFAVEDRIAAVRAVAGDAVLRVHFHNTRNTGLANTYAALRSGVTRMDASIGGVGGCPFAPRATGNVPTEDVVYMLERMGVITGLDLERLIDAAGWLGERLGPERIAALMGKAGPFPGSFSL